MNRQQPKIPSHTEATKQPKLGVQDTIKRAVQAEIEQKEVRVAQVFIDKFMRLFSDYSHHSGRSHKRKGHAASTRSSDAIMGELFAFTKRMPRPWRPAGNRPKPVHAMRYRYRRAA